METQNLSLTVKTLDSANRLQRLLRSWNVQFSTAGEGHVKFEIDGLNPFQVKQLRRNF
jgi:hypothetical protein